MVQVDPVDDLQLEAEAPRAQSKVVLLAEAVREGDVVEEPHGVEDDRFHEQAKAVQHGDVGEHEPRRPGHGQRDVGRPPALGPRIRRPVRPRDRDAAGPDLRAGDARRTGTDWYDAALDKGPTAPTCSDDAAAAFKAGSHVALRTSASEFRKHNAP